MSALVAVQEYELFIDGRFTPSSDRGTFEVVSPSDGRTWAEVAAATPQDVDRAVKAARDAFEGPWAGFLPSQRAALLRKLGDRVLVEAERLGHLQLQENGKLLREVVGQARLLADQCYFFAGTAEFPTGETLATSVPDTQVYTVREPIGVVAAITPWNSPLVLLGSKLFPAVAVGCTVVVKPSEITPVSTLELVRLMDEVGFPAGVVNVVTGGSEVGVALVDHPEVDKIAFTGSTVAGKAIAAAAARRVVPVSLELGGKSPNIVFPDADLARAVNGVIAGIFSATGQTCVAGSRVLVHAEIYERFAAELARRAAQIRVGMPLDPDAEIGTLSSRAQYEKVLDYIQIAKAEGATVAAGGKHPDDPALADGFFIEPTVLTGVTNDMRVAREEIFGPVAALIRFTDEDDAVRIANDSSFGLAAGVWTRDLGTAHRMTRRLRAGTVWVNSYRTASYAAPFGGFKESGIGRENGVHATDEFTELKTVWIDSGTAVRDPFNPFK